MARAIIKDVRDTRVGFIKTVDSYKSKITYDKPFTARINEVLPFRVKFINIGVPGYGPNNPPPIGIAIIGVNNYIL
jgi:hypothetical protein